MFGFLPAVARRRDRIDAVLLVYPTPPMAISHRENPVLHRPVRLANRDADMLWEFLLEDLAPNLFSLSWLEHHGVEPSRPGHFTFWGWLDDTATLQASALNISSRLLLIDARKPGYARGFGEFFRRRDTRFRHIVSRRDSVVPLWKSYRDPNARPPIDARLIQDQKLYQLCADDFSGPQKRQTPVRRARDEELDAVFLASVEMHREETLEDPLKRGGNSFRRHVRHRLENDRTFVWFENRRLVFKADISTQCSLGVQISGVYTRPDMRNRGIATRAMCDICNILFSEGFPRLTLYVNETNRSARHVYEKLGFQSVAPYQTVFIARYDDRRRS